MTPIESTDGTGAEQEIHKSPNKHATNHRTKSPQITEKLEKSLVDWNKRAIFAIEKRVM
jgi:hypothetical protein